MADNHGPSRAFTADIPSSPRPGNHPEAANPGDQPTTFRAPSTDPSESDEVLVDAADDDEDVRGYVMQDVEATVEEGISSEYQQIWTCELCHEICSDPWDLRNVSINRYTIFQTCPDPVFQSKRGEAALSYLAAEKCHTNKEDYDERERVRLIRFRRSALSAERRRLLQRAAWTKSGRKLLARNLNSRFHRRRHRLWRTNTPRTTWLRRLRHRENFIRNMDDEEYY